MESTVQHTFIRRFKGLRKILLVLIAGLVCLICGLVAYRCFCTGQLVGGGIFCLFAVCGLGCGKVLCRQAIGEKRGLRRLAAVGLTALVLIALVPLGVYAWIYQENFGRRFETYGPTAHSVADFEGLAAESCTFPAKQGQLLAGCLYQKGDGEKKGVIVLAHGFGGGGHRSYLSVIDALASGGYLVFAYDATGNDDSQGSAVGGLPQGVMDLDYALRYVKTERRLAGLPIGLWGHSWGAYSVCAVLEAHPDVKGVVAFSGFNRALDMIEYQGREIVGGAIRLLMPYAAFYEWLRFGGEADRSAMAGFAASEAKVMILHSLDDTVVPIQYGYDRYFSQYGTDSRFVFRRFADLGHNGITQSAESRAYAIQVDQALIAYLEGIDGAVRWQAESQWLEANLDKQRWDQPDEGLFAEILSFYGQALGREF